MSVYRTIAWMVGIVIGFEPTGDRPRADDKKRDYRLAVIGGVFAVLAAIAGGLVATNHRWPWSPSNSACRTNLSITSPRAGASVNGSQGVRVAGVACNMSGQTGWLFDYDLQDHYYYMDFPVNSTDPGPIVVGNGNWAYYDQPIGSRGDNKQTYAIAIVDASKACAGTLQSARPDPAGDIRFKSFPFGCQIENVTNVVVTYPQR
jgi:hypothetical protein